jgi:hypothetical protein
MARSSVDPGARIESLLDLPPMTDPDRVVLMSLLMHCIPPAYQVNPELFALICCKMVSLSIEHGNCPMSAKGYGSFAAILSGIVGNFRDGDRFGKLGVDLCETLNDVTVRSACHFTWAAFASAWVRPMDESIDGIPRGERWGLRAAIIPHAAYCASLAITNVMMRGTPLAAARAQADEACTCSAHRRLHQHRAAALTRRFIDWLHMSTATHARHDGLRREPRRLRSCRHQRQQEHAGALPVAARDAPLTSTASTPRPGRSRSSTSC